MELKLGYECKLYVGATASSAPNAGSEMTNIRDVTVSLTRTAVDATTRAAGPFKTYVPGLIDSEISFKMLADGDSSSNSICTSIRNAWLSGSAMAMKIDLGDGYYFMADFIITDMSNGQSLEDCVSYDVKVKPTLKDYTFKPVFGQES